MRFPKWYAVLPVFTGIFCCVGIFVCYAVAASNSQLPDYIWPFISDVGSKPPESCLFGFFMTWSGIGFATVGVIYYKYVSLQIDSKVNKAGLFFALLYSVGLTIVGSFQWTNAFSVHMVGAAGTFLGLSLHCWVATIMTWKYFRGRDNYHWTMIYFKLIIAGLSTSFTVCFLLFFNLRQNSVLLFTLATGAEWCAGLFGIVVEMSLAYDLRHITSIKLQISTSQESSQKTAKDINLEQQNNNDVCTNVYAVAARAEMPTE